MSDDDLNKTITITKGELIKLVSHIADNYMSKGAAIEFAMESTLSAGLHNKVKDQQLPIKPNQK